MKWWVDGRQWVGEGAARVVFFENGRRVGVESCLRARWYRGADAARSLSYYDTTQRRLSYVLSFDSNPLKTGSILFSPDPLLEALDLTFTNVISPYLLV